MVEAPDEVDLTRPAIARHSIVVVVVIYRMTILAIRQMLLIFWPMAAFYAQQGGSLSETKHVAHA